MKTFKITRLVAPILLAALAPTFAPPVAAQDYTVVTSSSAIVVTDVSGLADTLTVSESIPGYILFTSGAATFSVDGGPVLTNSSGALPYSNAFNGITINAGAGNDTINLQSFNGNLPSLTINGGTGDDTVNFNGNLSFATDANLNVDLQNDDPNPGTDTVNVAAYNQLVVSGTGTVVIRCSRNVLVDTYATLQTEAGALTVEANQQPVPANGDFIGVMVRGSIRINGSGALTVKGKGGTSALSSQHGIFVEGGTASILGGSFGTTFVEGTSGAAAGDFNYGVGVQGYDGEGGSALISTTGSDLNVTGVGVGAGISQENIGVALYFGGSIGDATGGKITILGTGGVGTGGNNRGVDLGSFGSGASTVFSDGGEIQITGIGGVGTGSDAVSLRSAGFINAYASNNITILADSLNMSNDSAINAGSGTVSLHPISTGVAVDVGSTGASGLALSADELNRITAAALVIGGTNANPVSISAPVNPTNIAALTLLSDSAVADLNAVATDVTVSNLTIVGQLTEGVGTGIFSVAGNLNLASNGSYLASIQNTNAGTGHNQINTTGAVNIGSNVTLITAIFGAASPVPGDSYIIVSRNGGTGTFAGLPEGASISNFLGLGATAIISYVGGTGDDVVLTVTATAAPEIGVQEPLGTDLVDGVGIVNLGTGLVTVSNTFAFTITNSGNANLSLGAITTNGPNADEFLIGAPGTNTLAPGASTTFTVTLAPTGLGSRNAAIQIFSDDADENPFDIALTGFGDVQPVMITCPSNIVVVVANSSNSAVVTWTNPVATGIPTPGVTSVPPPGSVFPLGTTSVLCTGTNLGSTNTCGFTVTVLAETSATALSNPVLCPGGAMLLSTVPSGSGPFAFSWSKDGSPLPGENNASLSVTNVAATNAGSYCVIVSGAANAVTNCGALTVNTNVSATTLSDVAVCPGTTVPFSTVASGTGPFAYAWLKDGTPLPGETNASLTLSNVLNTTAGNYAVVVQGLCSVVTNSAALTVWTNVSATTIADQSVCPGTTVLFSTVASGTGPFDYAWFKDTTPLVGETNASLTLTNVINGSEGNYSVVVQGLCTAVTNAAALTVWTNTSATALTSLQVCPGTTVPFSTVASGTGPFAYAWLKDGSPLPGETNASLTLTNVINGSEGNYSVVVQGYCTAVTNSVTLTVWTNTTATALTSVEVCPGTPVVFSTIASGTGPFSHAWLKNNSPLPGETNASLTLSNVVNATAGNYTVVVQGLCTAVTNSAALTVWTNVSATAMGDQAVCPGTPVLFSTIASGTGPFAFSWFKNGSLLSGETNALLTFTNVINGSEGVYSVAVQGFCTAVTNSATLTVWTNTAATALTSLQVCPGTPVVFSTIASGTGPFAYTWLKDSSPLVGATNASFTLTNTLNADAGSYSVVVQGLCTAVTNSAVLTVWTNVSFAAVPPVIIPPKQTANLCSPASGTGPITYQWFRNNNPIAGATNSCLTLTNVSLAFEGDYCVVAAGFCTTATNCVTFGILRDGVPPRIASAQIVCADNSAGLTKVLVTYNEEMYPPSALTLANYTIAGLNITNVSISNDGLTCLLETDAPFRCGFDYPLTVMSSLDISGEMLALTVTNLTTASLPCCNNTYPLTLNKGYSLVANQLDWRYNNLADKLPVMPDGSIVQLLKSNVVRTNATTADGYPIDPTFDTYTFSGGSWSGNPVLQPGSGFFIYVPKSTNLVIRGSKPAESLPVPFRSSLEAASRQVPEASDFQTIFGAPPIEGMAVFRMVSTNTPTPVRPPNFERHLFRQGVWEGGPPLADVGEAWLVQAIQPAVVTTNPVSQMGVGFGSTVTFNVAGGGSPPFRYQWLLNGLVLPGATGPTLTVSNLQLTNGGAYSATVDNFFNTAESAPAYVTFPLPNLPMTNNYANRVVLNAISGLGNSSNVGANKESGEPNHAGRAGGKSMWIDWQAPASGIVVFSTTGSGFDTLLAAYTSGTGGLTEVTSDEESGGFLTSRITFYAVAGQVYSIAVDGFSAESGPIVLGWLLEPTTETLPVLVAPPRSVVAGAGETVILNVTAVGSGLSYKWFFNDGPIPPPNRQGPDSKSELRMKNVGPQHVGTYFVRIFENDRYIDSQPIALQINHEGLDNRVRRVLTRDKLLDTITLPVPALATELFYPDAFTEESEMAAFTTSAAASTSATVQRSYTGTQILDTYGSVKQPGEPNHCGVPGGASQWYLYEPPEDGTAFINTDGSTFRTVLAVYTGTGESFATLIPVACAVTNSGSNSFNSRVSFPAKFGTPYYVAVDGVNAATGTVYLNYTLLKPVGLTSLSLTNGNFRVQAQVTPEVPAILQRTTNFTTWSSIFTNTSTNGIFQYTDTNSKTNGKSSYRLLQKP